MYIYSIVGISVQRNTYMYLMQGIINLMVRDN